jgi:short-subunit dehydrogenase
VTGGSAGVGRAVARAFGARGDRVAVLARGEDRLESAAKELDSYGATAALALPTDVADAAAVERAADAVERELGPIDIWVNDAMTSVFAPFWEINADEFSRVTAVTYLGYVNGTRAALSRMRGRNSGHIIQVGSALAYRAIPLQSAYCGAKHAVKGFTEAVRAELLHEHSNIAITMVELPAVNTPQFEWVLSRLPRRPRPVAPIYQPEVVAKAILHAAEHPRREYWVTWSSARAILGERLMPGVLDRVVARTSVDAQQTEEHATNGAANLWESVAGDWAARGRFNGEARGHSVTAALTRVRDGLLNRTGVRRYLDRASDRVAATVARHL